MHSTRKSAAKRAELVSVAEAMIVGKMDLIEGVRKITALRHEIGDGDDQVFVPIRAIESETDHFPVGAIRTQYTSDYLKRLDEEMTLYLADAKQDILGACREIVRMYSKVSSK
jgi:hypothetical protein